MWKFFNYEVWYWLRTPMLWIFLFVVSLLVFGAVASEQVQIGGGVGNMYKNAPTVVQFYYGIMSLICLLMTTAFMNATANRDFSTGMYQFVFTSPIRQRDYFFGKFLAAWLVAIIPLLGVSIGVLLGPLMPWVQPERYGPVIANGHLYGLLAFGLPNTLIAGSLLYALATVFRSQIVSFVGAMLILVFYVVSQGFTADLEKEWLANLLDPFGFQPLQTLIKYKTTEEKNLLATPLEGQLLHNRALWVGLSMVLLGVMYTRFSFYTRKQRVRRRKADAAPAPAKPLPVEYRPVSAPARLHPGHAFWHMVSFETRSIVKNQTFLIIVLIGWINLITSLTSFTGNYGTPRYPVTYNVIDAIQGSFYLFLIGIIVFYSGTLVWWERDAHIAEIEDATPVRTGQRFASKLLAMLISIFLILCSTILVGVVAQALFGYTRFELGVYAWQLLVLDMLGFAYLVVMALLLHYLINNRYVAYFAFVAFLVLNTFIWPVLELNSNMLAFGGSPSVTYSDMNGFGPFVPGLVGFHVYWILFCAILSLLVYAFYVRGRETRFGMRWQTARQRLYRRRIPLAALSVLFAAWAGWVYYNVEVRNSYLTSKAQERRSKEYELAYKQYEGLTQPRWRSIDYQIEIMPYARDLFVEVNAWVTNASDESIPALHFTLPTMPDSVVIEIAGASLELDDERLYYRIYTLAEPLAPGDSLPIRVRSQKVTRGFENEVSFTSLTQNGTFFNNQDILPVFGYVRQAEISDKNKRQKLGLPPRVRLSPLDPPHPTARQNNYISSDADWTQVRTVISTAPDQIAIAPGSLRREWVEGDRRYFEYQLDQASVNFYSFISARYEVAREKWQDVDLEVYYIPEHAYNVPNMLKSMRASLSYYTEHFGPYFHRQCRIIEFPRYGSFAQAFPGTMPYSEGIGFVADLRNVTDDDIDLVYYVVAHEMAHQYWAHQVIGASMRGTEMMSESFAQYAALMVMEKTYGRDKMNKFLKYEMNSYLRGRSNELEAERPLAETENQGYIHYNKGSVVMYYLKEMIGEAQVNKGLRQLIAQYAYREPPYPTSASAVSAFRSVTPDTLQYLIDDMFTHITLFSNRVTEATYQPEGEGYRVTLTTFSEKFRADSLGGQTLVPLDDYIDVAVFAPTDAKNNLGKPLVYERVKIREPENIFTYWVPEKPQRAGIDPYNYLVDRVPDDNVKRVSTP